MSNPRTHAPGAASSDADATPADDQLVADTEVIAEPDLDRPEATDSEVTAEPERDELAEGPNEGETAPTATAVAAEGPNEGETAPTATAVAAEEDERSREELLAELGEAEARRDEYLDDLRRARAEFENFRKRTVREAAGARAAGRADVVSALLDVLDDVDRTMTAADASADEALATGVRLVAEKLVRTLQGHGVARIDDVGVPFDPSMHEAVQHVPTDDPEQGPTVQEVLRPGYRLGDRVLRPAMVAVAD